MTTQQKELASLKRKYNSLLKASTEVHTAFKTAIRVNGDVVMTLGIADAIGNKLDRVIKRQTK